MVCIGAFSQSVPWSYSSWGGTGMSYKFHGYPSNSCGEIWRNHKHQSHGKVMGSPKSVGHIVWRPWMCKGKQETLNIQHVEIFSWTGENPLATLESVDPWIYHLETTNVCTESHCKTSKLFEEFSVQKSCWAINLWIPPVKLHSQTSHWVLYQFTHTNSTGVQ